MGKAKRLFDAFRANWPIEPSFTPPTPFRHRDVTRPRERTKSLEEVEAFVRHARLVDGFVSDRGKQRLKVGLLRGGVDMGYGQGEEIASAFDLQMI